jgi:hypothetical protein
MATKKDYASWQAGLRENSEELEDLDTFAEEMGGITRTEATRHILIMWSKARRGKLTQTYGFFASPMYPTNAAPALPSPGPTEKKAAIKRSKGNGNAAVQALDLD